MHGGSVAAASDGSGQAACSRYACRSRRRARQADAHVALDAVPDGLPVRRLRVLVVDDNRDSADSLRMLLGALGNEAKPPTTVSVR